MGRSSEAGSGEAIAHLQCASVSLGVLVPRGSHGRGARIQSLASATKDRAREAARAARGAEGAPTIEPSAHRGVLPSKRGRRAVPPGPDPMTRRPSRARTRSSSRWPLPCGALPGASPLSARAHRGQRSARSALIRAALRWARLTCRATRSSAALHRPAAREARALRSRVQPPEQRVGPPRRRHVRSSRSANSRGTSRGSTACGLRQPWSSRDATHLAGGARRALPSVATGSTDSTRPCLAQQAASDHGMRAKHARCGDWIRARRRAATHTRYMRCFRRSSERGSDVRCRSEP